MYEVYLRQLLSPLGVYDLGDGSVNGAELYALGEALDRTARRLETVERESVAATAEEEGLDRREALFARRPAAVTARERRDAVAALLQIDGDSLTTVAPFRAAAFGPRPWRWTRDAFGSSFPGWAAFRRSLSRSKK